MPVLARIAAPGAADASCGAAARCGAMRLILLAPLLLAASPPPVLTPAPPPPAGAAEAAPRLDLIRFFTGTTESDGVLKVAFRGDTRVRVRGRGRVEPDGTLVIEQDIEQTGKTVRHRTWRLREPSPGRYTGTLTGATTPIIGETVGGRVHLTFKEKHGYPVEQWLTLNPDGRSVRDTLAVRRFGLTFGSLDETIRKID